MRHDSIIYKVKTLYGHGAMDSSNGTSLVFPCYDLRFSDIVRTLGQPSWWGSGDNKCQANWVVKVGDKIVTIYDWKQPEEKIDDISDWHFGGDSAAADELYNEIKFIAKDCSCNNPGEDDGFTTCFPHHDCFDGSCTHMDGDDE